MIILAWNKQATFSRSVSRYRLTFRFNARHLAAKNIHSSDMREKTEYTAEREEGDDQEATRWHRWWLISYARRTWGTVRASDSARVAKRGSRKVHDVPRRGKPRSRLAVYVGPPTGSTVVAATFDVTSSYLRAILRMSKDELRRARWQVKTLIVVERKHERNFLSPTEEAKKTLARDSSRAEEPTATTRLARATITAFISFIPSLARAYVMDLF